MPFQDRPSLGIYARFKNLWELQMQHQYCGCGQPAERLHLGYFKLDGIPFKLTELGERKQDLLSDSPGLALVCATKQTAKVKATHSMVNRVRLD